MQVLARRLRLEGTFNFGAVAAKTPGYVGADLAALTKEAGANAITRVFTSLKPSRNVGHRSTICSYAKRNPVMKSSARWMHLIACP